MVDIYNSSEKNFQHDDEIDLKELFLALWKGKWIIFFAVLVFAGAGVFYALSQPNIFKAEAVLAPANGGGVNGVAGMASQLGGLASLAGINLGSNATDGKAIALATLKSRQFINAFITKHHLLVPLMAGVKWDSRQDRLLLAPKIYDEQRQLWVREVSAGQSPEPTDWEAYKVFKKNLTLSESKSDGLVTLSVTYFSPTMAKQWVDWLIADLNTWTKKKSLDETRRNINYLEGQIQKTNIADMQSVFYQLIEEQTKNLMLAEVQDGFAFKVIDPAVVPEEKAGPKRALTCILAVLLGGMLGMAIVLVRFAFTKKNNSSV